MDLHRLMRIITNERLQKKFTQKFYFVVKWYLIIFWTYILWHLI
jgi:hypothetical protein